MEKRHGARPDAPLEAIAHDQLVALPQLVDERPEIGEVVAVVGVAHDHVPASGRLNPAHQRTTVASGGHADDACAERNS